MNTEEYELKISHLEQKIESMEEDTSYLVGIFFGVISYYEWHIWWVSIPIVLISMFIMQKYISEKPFSKSLNNQ